MTPKISGTGGVSGALRWRNGAAGNDGRRLRQDSGELARVDRNEQIPRTDPRTIQSSRDQRRCRYTPH